jgi:ATP phosphoribosyltransferase
MLIKSNEIPKDSILAVPKGAWWDQVLRICAIAGYPWTPDQSVANGCSAKTYRNEQFNIVAEPIRPADIPVVLKFSAKNRTAIRMALAPTDALIEGKMGNLQVSADKKKTSYKPNTTPYEQWRFPYPPFYMEGEDPTKDGLRTYPTLSLLQPIDEQKRNLSPSQQALEVQLGKRLRVWEKGGNPIVATSYPEVFKQWIQAVSGEACCDEQIMQIGGEVERIYRLLSTILVANLVVVSDMLVADIVVTGRSAEANGFMPFVPIFSASLYMLCLNDWYGEETPAAAVDLQRADAFYEMLQQNQVKTTDQYFQYAYDRNYWNSRSPAYSLTDLQQKALVSEVLRRGFPAVRNSLSTTNSIYEEK